MEIRELQEQVMVWNEKRFPKADSWKALIKIGEEKGELDGHYLGRYEQRVGKETIDHEAGIKDSVADALVAMCVFCVRENIDLETEVIKVLEVINKRSYIRKIPPRPETTGDDEDDS